MNDITGYFTYKTNSNVFLENGDYYHVKGNNKISIISDEHTLTQEELAMFYFEYGKKISEFVDNLYIIVVEETHSVKIMCDPYSSQWNIYFTEKDGKLYYSTSLKKLLFISHIDRTINNDAVREFIKNGFLINGRTLLNNVFCLECSQELNIRADGYTVGYYANDYHQSTSLSSNDLIPSIKCSVKECIKNNMDEIFMPLSSGYDSNLILALIRQISDSIKVNTFTIGGRVGRNEINTVLNNIKSYNNVVNYNSIVDERILQYFTDIIWRLEGALFEGGVFLQYDLARLASKYGADLMICGECADERLKANYSNDMFNATTGKYDGETYCYFPRLHPFLTAHHIVLKKSSLILNSFGIKCVYPFMTNSIKNIAASMGVDNAFDKRAYKKLCEKEYMPSIINNIKRLGGSVDEDAYLTSDILNKIQEYLQRSQFHNQLDRFKNEHFFYSHSKQNLAGATEDVQLTLTMKELYLQLFNELFVSGKYDNFFYSSECPIKLSDIIIRLRS